MRKTALHAKGAPYKARLFRVCLLAFCILLTVYLFVAADLNTPVIMLKEGYADATSEEIAKRIYIVGGEMQRYEGAPTLDELAGAVPALTKDVRFMRDMSGNTYCFTLKVARGLSFFMARPGGARVWINGTEVKEDKVRSLTNHSLDDYATDGACAFVISAPKGSRGYRGILIGTDDMLSGLRSALAIADLVSMGLYLMIIVLCVALYVQKRSEKHLLVLCVIAVMLMVRWLPTVRFVGFESLGLGSFQDIIKVASFLRYFAFYPFLPEPLRKKVLPAVVALILVRIAAAVIGSVAVQDITLWLYIAIEGLVLVAGLMNGRPGCGVLLCGWGATVSIEVLYLLLNTGLVPQGVIDVYIQPMPYSGLFYLVCCTVAAFGVFARKYSEADEMSVNLERKVSERTAELSDANERLSRAQLDKQRFMADVAHNLRNPLFALGGYFDLLTKATVDPSEQQRRNMDRIEAKLAQINKMVDSILVISRLQDDKIEFHFTEFTLCEMMEGLRADAVIKAGDKGISIALECGDAPELIVGDRFWLQQALENLIDNAVRHSENGSGILICARAAENDSVRIEVIDKGCGIPEDRMPHIFDRYEGNGSGGTMGLGLTISREIARRHSGELHVESQEGIGTVAAIQLPRTQ